MCINQKNDVEENISPTETDSLLQFALKGLFVTAVFIVPPVVAINFLIV